MARERKGMKVRSKVPWVYFLGPLCNRRTPLLTPSRHFAKLSKQNSKQGSPLAGQSWTQISGWNIHIYQTTVCSQEKGIFSVWAGRQKQDWKFTKMLVFFPPSPQSMRKGGSSSGRLVEVPLGGWWWAGQGGLINLGCQLFFFAWQLE